MLTDAYQPLVSALADYDEASANPMAVQHDLEVAAYDVVAAARAALATVESPEREEL